MKKVLNLNATTVKIKLRMASKMRLSTCASLPRKMISLTGFRTMMDTILVNKILCIIKYIYIFNRSLFTDEAYMLKKFTSSTKILSAFHTEGACIPNSMIVLSIKTKILNL